MKTTDSNLWGGRSGHVYTFIRRPDGMTDVDAVVVREGKNLKGRALGLVLGTIGKGVLKKAFENTIKAIEARKRRHKSPRINRATPLVSMRDAMPAVSCSRYVNGRRLAMARFDYDVAIGSGFGGSVAALRAVGKRYRVIAVGAVGAPVSSEHAATAIDHPAR